MLGPAAVALAIGAALVACSSDASPRPPSSGPSSTGSPASTTAGVGAASCRGTRNVAHRDLAYREDPEVDPALRSLDLYEPVRDEGCGPAPVVVYVHGGGFRIGDKANEVADKVRLFTSEGWAFASVNYRLSEPRAGGGMPARYPVHEQDVAEAVAWIGQHASTYSVDPTRVLLLGHSSGAFIVSLLSTDTSFLRAAGVDPEAVRCTASLDTEYDVAAQVAQGGSSEQLYRNAFGDDPSTWAAGSPLTHTSAGAERPDFLVVTQGSERRTSGSEAFAERLRAGGTPARVLDAEPLDHEGVNAAVGAKGETAVTGPLLEFYRSCAAAG